MGAVAVGCIGIAVPCGIRLIADIAVAADRAGIGGVAACGAGGLGDGGSIAMPCGGDGLADGHGLAAEGTDLVAGVAVLGAGGVPGVLNFGDVLTGGLLHGDGHADRLSQDGGGQGGGACGDGGDDAVRQGGAGLVSHRPRGLCGDRAASGGPGAGHLELGGQCGQAGRLSHRQREGGGGGGDGHGGVGEGDLHVHVGGAVVGGGDRLRGGGLPELLHPVIAAVVVDAGHGDRRDGGAEHIPAVALTAVALIRLLPEGEGLRRRVQSGTGGDVLSGAAPAVGGEAACPVGPGVGVGQGDLRRPLHGGLLQGVVVGQLGQAGVVHLLRVGGIPGPGVVPGAEVVDQLQHGAGLGLLVGHIHRHRGRVVRRKCRRGHGGEDETEGQQQGGEPFDRSHSFKPLSVFTDRLVRSLTI